MIRLAVSGQFLMIANGQDSNDGHQAPPAQAPQNGRTTLAHSFGADHSQSCGKAAPNPAVSGFGGQPEDAERGDGDGRGGGAAVPFLLDGLHGAQVADTAAAVGRRGCCPRYLPLGYFPVRMPARRNTATWT